MLTLYVFHDFLVLGKSARNVVVLVSIRIIWTG